MKKSILYFKKNSLIIEECLLKILDSLCTLMILDFVFERFPIGSAPSVYRNFYLLLFVKALLGLWLFSLNNRKEKRHGSFKNNLRKTLLKAIFKIKEIDNTLRTGEIATDVWIGVEWIGAYYFEAIPQVLSTALILLGILIYMVFVNWITAAVLIGSLAVRFVIKGIFSPAIDKSNKNENRENEAYSQMSIEALQGLETLKSLNAVSIYLKKLNAKTQKLHKASMRFVRLTALSKGLQDFILMALKLLSIVSLLQGHLKGGQSRRFLLMNIFIVFLFYMKINLLYGASLKISRSKTFKKKIDRIIQQASLLNERAFLSNPSVASSCQISIRDLSLSYPHQKQAVLQNITLNIEKGCRLALIGPSGCGKSSLLKCLCGFIPHFSGSIYISGRNLSCKDNLQKIKNEMSVIWQDNHIFSASVLENVRMAKKDASEEEVVSALKNANMYDTVRALPQGLQTPIGNGGYELSGGQKSRIAIARAFLRDSSIILLDEPTSELDRENEFEILANLKSLYKGKTVIQTAHRLETIKDFDQICFLKDGNLLLTGKHDDLLKASALYRNYFENLQKET